MQLRQEASPQSPPARKAAGGKPQASRLALLKAVTSKAAAAEGGSPGRHAVEHQLQEGRTPPHAPGGPSPMAGHKPPSGVLLSLFEQQTASCLNSQSKMPSSLKAKPIYYWLLLKRSSPGHTIKSGLVRRHHSPTAVSQTLCCVVAAFGGEDVFSLGSSSRSATPRSAKSARDLDVSRPPQTPTRLQHAPLTATENGHGSKMDLPAAKSWESRGELLITYPTRSLESCA